MAREGPYLSKLPNAIYCTASTNSSWTEVRRDSIYELLDGRTGKDS